MCKCFLPKKKKKTWIKVVFKIQNNFTIKPHPIPWKGDGSNSFSGFYSLSKFPNLKYTSKRKASENWRKEKTVSIQKSPGRKLKNFILKSIWVNLESYSHMNF